MALGHITRPKERITRYLMEGPGLSVLFGRDWMAELKLPWDMFYLQEQSTSRALHQLLQRYRDVFTGNIGKLNGVKAKLMLMKDTT